MKINKSRSILIIISGILEILVGVFILVDPMDNLSYLMIFCGFSICILGILYIFSFMESRQSYFRPGWVLPLGIGNLFTGLLLIMKNHQDIEVLSVLLGIYAIAAGAMQAAASIQIRALEIRKWWWITAGSVVNLLAGLMIFIGIGPDSGFFIIPLGIFFITLGISSVTEFFVYK